MTDATRLVPGKTTPILSRRAEAMTIFVDAMYVLGMKMYESKDWTSILTLTKRSRLRIQK